MLESRSRSPQTTLALSLTALILYFPANLFPFMSIEMYGSRHSATIWGGVVELARGGSWPIALVILLASIVIPFVKLALLFYLALTATTEKNRRRKVRLYAFVEAIGRWSMLDIFLLAILVALIKLGPWGSVHPELGSWLFASVVVFTMFASMNFKPELLEDDDHERS